MIYTVSHLSKTFHTKKPHIANHDITFSINEGEIFSILGNNGAGKTTLIKQMLKLINPTSGEIFFDEKNIKAINNSVYYRRINAVLEGNRNLYWYLTGYQNIMYFGRLFGYSDKELKIRGRELLEFFGLYNERHQKVGYYSRGMQQKMAIIVALINKPRVLFLDEPTLGLDIHAKKEVIKKVKCLSEEEHTTIILTSHQLDVIEQLTNQVMVLDKGNCLFLGNIAQLKHYYSDNKYHLRIQAKLTREEVAKFFENFQLKISDNGTDLNLYVQNYDELQSFIKYLASNNYQLVHLFEDSFSLEEVMFRFYEKQSVKREG
ncbi:MAG: ABC transporter ATP-binding protein [Sporolactobacillus sp.]